MNAENRPLTNQNAEIHNRRHALKLMFGAGVTTALPSCTPQQVVMSIGWYAVESFISVLVERTAMLAVNAFLPTRSHATKRMSLSKFNYNILLEGGQLILETLNGERKKVSYSHETKNGWGTQQHQYNWDTPNTQHSQRYHYNYAPAKVLAYCGCLGRTWTVDPNAIGRLQCPCCYYCIQ